MKTKVTRTDRDEIKLHTLPIFGGKGVAIPHQEERGQQQLTSSDQLPTRGLEEMKQILEAFGGRVIGPTRGDPLFTDVVLPKGWTKKPTDHNLHIDLVDEQGRKRASIFYKAAFYDRDANISASTCLQASSECVDYDDVPKLYFPVIRFAGVALWRGALRTAWTNEEMKATYAKARADGVPYESYPKDADELCRKEAWELLLKTFPQAKDPLKYWDQDEATLRQQLPAWESQPVAGEKYIIGVTIFQRNLIRRVREVEAWQTGNWKTKKFPNDDAATDWVNTKLPDLLARSGNYCRAVVSLRCGDRFIIKNQSVNLT